MDWDAVGAVAELIGAIGVILSLIYLAKQIRSNSETISTNTKAVLSGTETSSNDQVIAILTTQIENAEVADIAKKGHAGREDMEGTEQRRYALLLLAIFETHQTYFVQHARGSAGPEIWEYYTRVFDDLCKLPGVRKWWAANRIPFHPAYREYIDIKMRRRLVAHPDCPCGL